MEANLKYYVVTITRQSSGYEDTKNRLVQAPNAVAAEEYALDGESHDAADWETTGIGYDPDGLYWVNEYTIATVDNVVEVLDPNEVATLEKYLCK